MMLRQLNRIRYFQSAKEEVFAFLPLRQKFVYGQTCYHTLPILLYYKNLTC